MRAPRAELDEMVIEIMGITEEQLAVEFPDDAAQTGPKVLHRMLWARSYLKKLGAVDSAGRGRHKITAEGRHYLGLDDGEVELLHHEHELRVGRHPELYLKRLVEEVERATSVATTVRSLIGEWGVKRRGSEMSTRIARDLQMVGLTTKPSFGQVPLDQEVEVIALPLGDTAPASEADAPTEPLTVTIGTLPTAAAGVRAVSPDAPLLAAQSIMERHDYSQLAVLTGERDLKGVVSWESIAQASLYGPQPRFVREAMSTSPVVVDHDVPLLEHIETIAEAGYVFVRDETQRINGIVTASDLSYEFEKIANPFLLLGEIEGWLRQIVDATFTADDLAAYVDPSDPDRQIEAAQSLTFGEYVRLFQDVDAWSALALRADRKVFSAHVDEVRQIRNSIMHFSPDPLAEEDLDSIKALLRWLRKLAMPRG